MHFYSNTSTVHSYCHSFHSTVFFLLLLLLVLFQLPTLSLFLHHHELYHRKYFNAVFILIWPVALFTPLSTHSFENFVRKQQQQRRRRVFIYCFNSFAKIIRISHKKRNRNGKNGKEFCAGMPDNERTKESEKRLTHAHQNKQLSKTTNEQHHHHRNKLKKKWKIQTK